MLGDWLEVKLQVKQKFRDDRRHIVELVAFVLKVFVLKMLTHLLMLPLDEQLLSALPFVHHFKFNYLLK